MGEISRELNCPFDNIDGESVDSVQRSEVMEVR